MDRSMRKVYISKAIGFPELRLAQACGMLATDKGYHLDILDDLSKVTGHPVLVKAAKRIAYKHRIGDRPGLLVEGGAGFKPNNGYKTTHIDVMNYLLHGPILLTKGDRS